MAIKKLIPYSKQWINHEDITEVVKVLKSDWITQGPKIEEFEKTLARYVSAKYAVAVSNGTAALHLACLVAGIGPSDEVIIPTLSFVATANCVLYCGAKPVLVDVYEDTLTINVEDVENKITKKTKAIIAVDFAGHPADWDKLKELAKKHNLILIDDAAHALGSKYRGKMIGSIADFTCFSFHPVKIITTGDGGAVITNNKNYYEKLLSLKHHGIVKTQNLSKKYGDWYYDIKELGFNYRLTDIQASLGISQLKNINSHIKRRRSIWQRYQKALDSNHLIKLPTEKEGCFCAWHIFPIKFNLEVMKKNRRQVFDELKDAGIRVQVHYIPIHLLSF